MKIWHLLIPYRFETFKSNMLVEEINKRIIKHTTIQESLYFSFDRGDKDFHGIKTDNGFRIRRTIFYQNSFLPTINIKTNDGITERFLETKMWLPWGILAFMIFFCIAFYAGAGLFPRTEIIKYLPLIIYIVLLVAFHIEAGIAIRGLKKILSLTNTDSQ